MIDVVNDKELVYIKKILKEQFNISYERGAFSREIAYKINNQIIGIIIYDFIYDRIELDYIYVDISKRNMGIASKLMSYMIADGKNSNASNITLEVNVNNEEAIALYKKFDFNVVATRKNYYNNEDGYLMIRE